MQQSKARAGRQSYIVVYEAESSSEAMVLRGLLESAGIESPQPTPSDPFPVPSGGMLTSDNAVYAHESRAEDARKLIASKSKGETSS